VGGPTGQADFVNAAAAVETSLSPHALVERLQDIEAQFGRARIERWGPRTLDLDLLLYGEEQIHDGQLVVPHPRMTFRRFVLEPAAEVASEMVHPVTGRRIGELLTHLRVAAHYVAIGGISRSARTWLAGALARNLGGPLLLEERISAETATEHQSPVPPLAQTVRFVEQASGLVHRDYWSAHAQLFPLLGGEGTGAEPAPPAPAVSSFWLGQWRLWACLYAPGEAAQAGGAVTKLLKALETSLDHVVQPRLVVWLDVVPAMTPRMEERLAACLDELFSRSCVGPLLRLAHNDPDLMLTECTAAIEAMQPLVGVIP
jgi:7,8-dihydro-6-hydroxymethylpterin-pyrophosphokinase